LKVRCKERHHLVTPKPEPEQKKNNIVYSDSRFSFFEPFFARLASKLGKNAYMTPKPFQIILIQVKKRRI
jgi:hypothetical protein